MVDMIAVMVMGKDTGKTSCRILFAMVGHGIFLIIDVDAGMSWGMFLFFLLPGCQSGFQTCDLLGQHMELGI